MENGHELNTAHVKRIHRMRRARIGISFVIVQDEICQTTAAAFATEQEERASS